MPDRGKAANRVPGNTADAVGAASRAGGHTTRIHVRGEVSIQWCGCVWLKLLVGLFIILFIILVFLMVEFYMYYAACYLQN